MASCCRLLRASRLVISSRHQQRAACQGGRQATVGLGILPGRHMGRACEYGGAGKHFSLRRYSVPSGSLAPDSHDGALRELVQGKSFMCTMCGKCCTGEGQVWISEEDGLAIANDLGLSHSHFLVKYTKSYNKYDGWRLLKDRPDSDDCIFLEQGTACSIHQVRPLQCRTYPWWPGVVESAEAWEAERENMCEGIGNPEADALDVGDAVQMLKKQTETEMQRKMSYRQRK